MGFDNIFREQNRFMAQINMEVFRHIEIVAVFDRQLSRAFLWVQHPLLVDVTQCFRQANNLDDIIESVVIDAVLAGKRISVHL